MLKNVKNQFKLLNVCNVSMKPNFKTRFDFSMKPNFRMRFDFSVKNNCRFRFDFSIKPALEKRLSIQLYSRQ